MRDSLWAVLAIVAAIVGFLMGYATAPMIEAGMLGGGPAAPAAKSGAREELERYYRSLIEEN